MDLQKPDLKYRDEVVRAASDRKADLYTVAKHFGVHPALVRFWLRKYPISKSKDVSSKKTEPSSFEKKVESFGEWGEEFSNRWPFSGALIGIVMFLLLIVGCVLLIWFIVALFNPDFSDHREELYIAKPAIPLITPYSAKTDWAKHKGKVVIWDVIVSKVYTGSDQDWLDKTLNFSGTSDKIDPDGPFGYRRCFKRIKTGSRMRVKGIIKPDWDGDEYVVNSSRKFEGLKTTKSEARLLPAYPLSCLEEWRKTTPPLKLLNKCKDYWCNSHFSDCDAKKKLCLKKLGWKAK
jgi:hypothetical protein